MQEIRTVAALEEAIKELETAQCFQRQLLKEQLRVTVENLKPINILKNAVSEFSSAPDFKNNLISSSIALAAGYLSKAIVVGASHNPIKKIVGSILQMEVVNVVARNREKIKGLVNSISGLFSKKKESIIENN